MERRRLGRLEHLSSVLIYGGAALSDVSEPDADRSITFALEAGVNHFDTAAAYGDSEVHLGRWMSRIRDRIFLATKTGDRSADGAYESIHRSLGRLQVDHVDLIQIHAVGDPNDLDRATGAGGAIDGLVRAKEEGLAGAIGITGHGMQAPATHLEALRRYPFDTVLTPFNFRLAREAGYLRDFEALAAEAREQDVGLMLIKAIARNLWPSAEEHRYATWYEPIDEQRHVDAALAFALARPEVTGICTAGDVGLIPRLVDAERRARARSIEDVQLDLASLPDYEPPFVRVEGRHVPEWLDPSLPG
jgi:aryl-alcohol dehydrogenase-like predicted oxidoreductase